MLGTFLVVLKAVIKGVIAGGLTNLIGYAKQEGDLEKWDIGKALKTTIIGAITGGLVYGSKLPVDQIAVQIATWLEVPAINGMMVEMFILTMIVIVADQLVKIVIRRTDLMNLWNKFKDRFTKYF